MSHSTGGALELEHRYGERVHLLDDAWLAAALARISAPETKPPELLGLLRSAYRCLAGAALGRSLPRARVERTTRMGALHGEAGVWRGEALDPTQRIVVVDVIRAGIVPSQVVYELLASVLPPDNVRLDHLHMTRVSDASGRVSGVDLGGSKIGGTVEGAWLVIADPMGATGATLLRAVNHYRDFHGAPRGVLAMPLVATPEFLRAATRELDNCQVWSGRLDRGLSPPDVLATLPGERWDEERGLDDHDYVVPGCGGMGEVLNNSWC